MHTKKKVVPHRIVRSLQKRPNLKGGEGKSRHHYGHGERHTSLFAAGEIVKETGIYEVVHDQQHRTAHEVVMLSGDSFPPCETCEERVRFRLIRTAPYIFQDEDFGESD